MEDGTISEFESMTDPIPLGDEVLFPLGMVCDDGVVVERVSLDGLELVTVEFDRTV